jgi:hypothetical protein
MRFGVTPETKCASQNITPGAARHSSARALSRCIGGDQKYLAPGRIGKGGELMHKDFPLE